MSIMVFSPVNHSNTKGDQMERGTEINGGKFVGKTKTSSVWAWYPGSDLSFPEMCELFDKIYG